MSRRKEGVVYADVFGATMAAMLKAKAVHGERYVFESEAGEACSLVVASAFLKALGCDGNIGTITVDFAAGKAEGSPGQKIVSFQDNTLTVESTRCPFWFPGHGVGATDPRPWPILKCLTFDKELNRYTLIVKNLPTAQTKIYWGDQQRDFSSEELAKGVNLAAAMPGWGNPFGGRFSDVDNGVRMQQQQEDISGSALIRGKPDPQADAKREAALQVAKGRLVPVKYQDRNPAFGPGRKSSRQGPSPSSSIPIWTAMWTTWGPSRSSIPSWSGAKPSCSPASTTPATWNYRRARRSRPSMPTTVIPRFPSGNITESRAPRLA